MRLPCAAAGSGRIAGSTLASSAAPLNIARRDTAVSGTPLALVSSQQLMVGSGGRRGPRIWEPGPHFVMLFRVIHTQAAWNLASKTALPSCRSKILMVLEHIVNIYHKGEVMDASDDVARRAARGRWAKGRSGN